MTITFLMGFFLPVPPVCGGAMEKSTLDLASRLAARGHIVTIISRQWPDWPDQETLEGIRHLRMPGGPHSSNLAFNLLRDLQWAWRASRAVPAGDVVVTHSIFSPWLLARWRRDAGVVLPWMARMPKAQLSLYRGLDGILAASSAVKVRVERAQPALGKRTRVIPLPIDGTLFHAAAEARDFGERKPVVIGYAGRIHRLKGVDLLIQAGNLLAERAHLPAWKLRVIGPSAFAQGGSGEAYRDTLRAAQSEKLAGLAEWENFVTNPHDLARCYGAMDIFVYPSRDAQGETFGAAVVEAMAAGTAPVVSSLDCFREYLVPDHNGLVFQESSPDAAARLAEALERLLVDAALRRSLGRQAAKDAMAFDGDKICDRIEAVFSEMMTAAEK